MYIVSTYKGYQVMKIQGVIEAFLDNFEGIKID